MAFRLFWSPCRCRKSSGSAAEKLSDLTLAAVPALWRTWHETNAIPAATRLAISAGAPLPAALERDIFQARELKIHNFYGSTECGGIAYDATEIPRAQTVPASARPCAT